MHPDVTLPWDELAKKRGEEIESLKAELAISRELCTKFEALKGEDVEEMLRLRSQNDDFANVVVTLVRERDEARNQLVSVKSIIESARYVEPLGTAESSWNDALDHVEEAIFAKTDD